MSDPAHETNAQIDRQDSNQDERLALAAAAAIQRLIAERNALRSQAVAQARELMRLRHHISLIRDSYRRLTAEFVTQLELADSVVSHVLQKPLEPADSPTQAMDRNVPSN
jgi:hypothetical protein